MLKLGRSRSSTTSLFINKPTRTHQSMANGQCKKHPKHKQSPGVCSLCLSEKLSRVSTSISSARVRGRARAYYSSSSSLSSSEDSSYASSPDASPPRAHHHRRIVSDVNNRRSSMAPFVGKENEGHNDNNNNTKNEISGFWAKLLGPKFGNNRDQRRTSDLNNNKMISRSQPLASSSTMVVY